jgi:hypothetical protein
MPAQGVHASDDDVKHGRQALTTDENYPGLRIRMARSEGLEPPTF